jgi:hypothetical protein
MWMINPIIAEPALTGLKHYRDLQIFSLVRGIDVLPQIARPKLLNRFLLSLSWSKLVYLTTFDIIQLWRMIVQASAHWLLILICQPPFSQESRGAPNSLLALVDNHFILRCVIHAIARLETPAPI